MSDAPGPAIERHRIRRLTGPLVLLVVLAAPALALSVLSSRLGRLPDGVDIRPTPEFTTPVERLPIDVVPARVSITAADRFDVRSSPMSGSGTVTAVFIAVDDAVSDGQPLYAADGRTVLAAMTPAPFHRALQAGAVGPDVEMLEDWMAGIGFPLVPDQIFGPDTTRAVEALNQLAGAGPRVRAFDPASVTWLPQPGSVQSIAVSVGAATPAAGATIATLRVGEPVIVVKAGDDREITGALRINGSQLGDVRDGKPTPPTARTVLELVGDGTIIVEGEPDAAIRSFAADIVVTATATTVAVPAGSVIDDGDTTCLFVRTAGTAVRPFRTTITGGDLGLVDIDPVPESGAEVLVNPLAVIERPSCSSR